MNVGSLRISSSLQPFTYNHRDRLNDDSFELVVPNLLAP